jgi:hypothetical protein
VLTDLADSAKLTTFSRADGLPFATSQVKSKKRRSPLAIGQVRSLVRINSSSPPVDGGGEFQSHGR